MYFMKKVQISESQTLAMTTNSSNLQIVLFLIGFLSERVSKSKRLRLGHCFFLSFIIFVISKHSISIQFLKIENIFQGLIHYEKSSNFLLFYHLHKIFEINFLNLSKRKIIFSYGNFEKLFILEKIHQMKSSKQAGLPKCRNQWLPQPRDFNYLLQNGNKSNLQQREGRHFLPHNLPYVCT